MKKTNIAYLKNFIIKQRCIPWFLLEKFQPYVMFILSKFGMLANEKYSYKTKKKNVLITFIVPHKDCSTYLKLCVESIRTFAKGLNYKIIVADDCSDRSEYNSIKALVATDLDLYRFNKNRTHPFVLEWLYNQTRSQYVVVIDQDSILLKNYWENFINEFQTHPELLLIGIRDDCLIRHSPQMLHPSFIMLNKKKCNKVLKKPLFFGKKINYENYTIKANEPYHSLTCKALHYNCKSIKYLDTYQTKYGFGTIGYYKQEDNPIVYHQWYSGRIYLLNENEIKDGFKVKDIKYGIMLFLRDKSLNCANFCKNAMQSME